MEGMGRGRPDSRYGCVITSYSIHYTKLYDSALRSAGYRTVIVSGDRQLAVARIAERLGVDEWHAAMTPADKLAFVGASHDRGERVIMVGDGINDAPVLAAADASVALDAGTALARASADAVSLGSNVITSYSIHYTKLYEVRVETHRAGPGAGRPALQRRMASYPPDQPARRRARVEHAGLSVAGRDSGRRRSGHAEDRITSYNVCYTKLLRSTTPSSHRKLSSAS